MYQYFTWNMDPEIFRLGSFAPRYYGLMFAAGFLLGYQIMQWVFRREGKDEKDLSSLLLHIMLGTIIGARLGHTLFYEPLQYLSNPIEILYIWKGGLASHGGSIGVFVGLWLYARKHHDQPLVWLMSRLAAPIALTASFIRIGNFFNSEIVGSPSNLPWAIIFPAFERVPVPRHPSMLYEALAYFFVFLVLIYNYKKKGTNLDPGKQIGIIFMGAFGFRIFIEFLKEDQVAFEAGLLLNMGQLLSIPFVIFGIIMYSGYYKRFLPAGSLESGPPTGKNGGRRPTKRQKKPLDRSQK